MRRISGFERPWVQWLFVAIGAALVVVAIAEVREIRRGRARLEAVRAEALKAQLERDDAQLRVAREQSAREALSLEVSRLRGPVARGDAPPTLTLTPVHTRGATPPPPTVAPPAPAQVIALRMVLPPTADTRRPYAIVMRDWSGGATLWTRAPLSATRTEGRLMVVALVAGDVFARGAYELILTVIDTNGQPSEVAAYELTIG